MRQWLGESERDGRGAKERERKKGDGLIVAASGEASNDDKSDRRDDDPERREDDARETRGNRGEQPGNHHDGDAEQHERFVRPEPAHGARARL
jgi:hypothetical protein